MWTENDKRYLRSLRIVSSDPPSPLPRFQVETAAVEGEYQVIDRLIQFRATHTIAATFNDPRSVADAIATELNTKYESKV